MAACHFVYRHFDDNRFVYCELVWCWFKCEGIGDAFQLIIVNKCRRAVQLKPARIKFLSEISFLFFPSQLPNSELR
jgi:hypothetical protein